MFVDGAYENKGLAKFNPNIMLVFLRANDSPQFEWSCL